jgi:hypothetical protein
MKAFFQKYKTDHQKKETYVLNVGWIFLLEGRKLHGGLKSHKERSHEAVGFKVFLTIFA